MSEKGGGEFFVGFVFGALAGAAAALLMAPTSGEETRQQLSERGVELKQQAEKMTEGARMQAQQLAEKARSQAGHLEEQGRIVLSDKVRQAQAAIQEAESRLGAAKPQAAPADVA